MSKLTFIFGTRPEAIKIAPVVQVLRTQGLQPDIICTGQHSDLLDGSPARSVLSQNCTNLGLSSDGDIMRWLTKAERALTKALPSGSLVIVQGDTMSALAGARAAVERSLPLAHIEAGIRSHAREPWPEEDNRVAIAQLADWHYAPTAIAEANLLQEGVDPSRIQVTGNSVISALFGFSQATWVAEPDNKILITLHRHEIKKASIIIPLLLRLGDMASRFPATLFVFPVHPAVRKLLSKGYGSYDNIIVCDPMPYEQFTRELARSRGIVTDSGGAVEEAAALGVTSAILRSSNDRPEAVVAGLAQEFIPDPDGLAEAIQWLLGEIHPRVPSDCFGTKDAATNIATHLRTVACEPLPTVVS